MCRRVADIGSWADRSQLTHHTKWNDEQRSTRENRKRKIKISCVCVRCSQLLLRKNSVLSLPDLMFLSFDGSRYDRAYFLWDFSDETGKQESACALLRWLFHFELFFYSSSTSKSSLIFKFVLYLFSFLLLLLMIIITIIFTSCFWL